MSEYSNPEVLVSTEWVAEHIDDPDVVIVESNEDILLYETGHIQNAVKGDWQNELQDQLIRDYVNKENFEKLMSEKGISNDHTVVFYGDRSNWWACYAFWTFKVLGHEKCLIMNGGRQKWVDEDRPLTKDVAELTGGRFDFEEDPVQAARNMIDHIDEKRKALGLGPTMYPVPYEGKQDVSLRSGSSGAHEPVAALTGPQLVCPGSPGSTPEIQD